MASLFRRFHVSGSSLKPNFGVWYFPRCGFTEPRQAKKQIEYSSAQLVNLRYFSESSLIDQTVHQILKYHGILKPFDGCRAGIAVKATRVNSSLNIPVCQQNRRICIPDQSRKMSRNLVQFRRGPTVTFSNKMFGPAIVLANMMSLSPKIDELRCFVNDKRPDLVSLTETWTYDSDACDHHLQIPDYNLIPKNRTVGIHGGVGLYIDSKIKFKALTDLYHPNFEVLWAHHRPSRLPRGYPCIVFGTVYHTLHPEGACDNAYAGISDDVTHDHRGFVSWVWHYCDWRL